MLALTLFGAYRSEVPFSDLRVWGAGAAIGLTYAVLPMIRWETVLFKRRGEVLLALSALLLIVSLALMSTSAPIQPLIFIDYFAVISFTAALGSRSLHFGATALLLGLNIIMLAIFGSAPIRVQDLIATSATLIIVAIVLSAVTGEFRFEAYAGRTRELELAKREQELERLYEVSRTMADGQSLKEVLPTLVGKIGTFLEAEIGIVLLHQPRSASLKVLSPIWTSGAELDVGDYEIFLRNRGQVAQVFQDRQSRIQTHDPERPGTGLFGELGIREGLTVPLVVDQRPIGVMVIADKQTGPFTDDDLRTLESLAAPAALILSQMERYEVASETSRKMEELARMKTDFVSVVSHELRTPLTSIIGSSGHLGSPRARSERTGRRGSPKRSS